MPRISLPRGLEQASLYVLLVALLGGALWRGGYFPTQKLALALTLLTAGAIEIAVCAALRRAGVVRSPGFWLLATFTLYAVATRFWTVAPESTDRETMIVLGYLAAFFVVRSQLQRRGRQAMVTVASWLVYTGSFVTAWGLVTFLWRREPYATVLDGILRAGSTFEYSNALSCFALMALPVTVALQRLSPPRERPLLSAAASLQAAAVLISFARFGIVALAAMAIYLILTGWRGGFFLSTLFSLVASVPLAAAATLASESGHPYAGLAAAVLILSAAGMMERLLEVPGFRRAMSAVAVAVAAMALAATAILAGTSERLRAIVSTRFSEGFSWSRLLPHRLDTWQGSVDSFRERPVSGSGLGSFSQIFTEHAIAVYTKYAHNLILQTAVDTGIIGAFLMVAFLAYIAGLSCWRLVFKAEPLVRAFAITALVFIVYNTFDWEWYVPALTAWFMAAAACLEGIPETVLQKDVSGHEGDIDDADDPVHGHEGRVHT